MELHLRGTLLPDRVPVELWTDNGRISVRPVADAQTIATEAFILPGLVDAHTHPGGPGPGQPLDEALLRADLAASGLPPAVALRAACWTARGFFGLPGIADGAPADLVVYDRDPLADLSVLDHPSHVVLNGHLRL